MQNHTKIGSKISFYMNGNEQHALSSDTEPFIEKKYKTVKIAIPENCEYRNIDEQKCTIPLITKIKEYSFREVQKWVLQQMMNKGYTPNATNWAKIKY